MLVINGFFENGVFVPEKPLTGIKGRQKAVLNIEETDKDKRAEGFQRFMQYQGTLPAEFDYKKELTGYRDERHGLAD
ncbi:MAG: hypothetical protein LBV20_02770 [Treponema sp.]|jgi:hypothetical protein|nr:hypothetical protein [Treponema sp.]